MKALGAGKTKIDQIRLREKRRKNHNLRLNKESVGFFKVREIILKGMVEAKSISDIQKDIEEQAMVSMTAVAIQQVITRYLVSIEESSLEAQVRWQQNKRYDAVLHEAMKKLNNDELSLMELKRIAEIVRMIQLSQARLLGLNKEKKSGEGQSGAGGPVIQMNFNINTKEAGYPEPIEHIVDAEVVEDESN